MTSVLSVRRYLSGPSALWVVLFVVAFGTNVPTPLLLVYRDTLGLSATALTGAFGLYAAGLVPTLLLSHGAVLVDQPMPLRDLIGGLAEAELPGHTKQLLALL